MTSGAKFLIIRLRPHDDLKLKIADIVRKEEIKAGAVISCVGSLEKVHLRFANRNEGTRIDGHHEILSLSGTVSLEGLHLHLSVANTNGQVTGGHLLDENFIYTTAEIVIAIFSDVTFSRATDPTYGYRELLVQKTKK